MRIKKMLAVLAAISMLASMGISAAAEDETAVTTAEEAVTTAATEATTLTETEITTTAETTTDSEKETTVATEENETVEEVLEDGTVVYGTKTYQMGENGDGTPDFHEVKVVLYSDITEDWDETERLSVYVDGTLSNLAGIAVGSAIAGDGPAHDYRDNPDNFFAITGVDEIAITAYGVATSYYYDHSSGQFVDSDQEKTFNVEIPYAYFTVIDSVTGEIVTKSGANKSMVNAVVTECTNGTVVSLNEGNEVPNNADRFLQSITVKDVKPGKLTINGTCQSYSSLSEEERNAGYTTLPHAGDAIENKFTLTVTIDENGNITGTSPVTPDEPEKTFNVEIPLDYVQLYVAYNNKSPDWNGEWTLCDDQRKIRSIEVSRLNISTSNGTIADVIGGCDYCDEHSFLRSIKLKDVKPGKLHMESNVIFTSSEGEGYHGVTSKPDDGWKLVVDVTSSGCLWYCWWKVWKCCQNRSFLRWKNHHYQNHLLQCYYLHQW